MTTNERGMFDLSSYATPGNRNLVGLEVSAAGYVAAYTTYWDLKNVDPQVFFVQLHP